MIESHSKKKHLSETQEVDNINQYIDSEKMTTDETASHSVPGHKNIHPTQNLNKDEMDPLNILKIRLAKDQITKAEYEEMRKIIESQ